MEKGLQRGYNQTGGDTQGGDDKEEGRLQAKLLRKDAAMVTTEHEEQEFVLLVAEGDGIRYKAQKAESEEESKKRKRDITPPRKAGYEHEEELMGNLEPSMDNNGEVTIRSSLYTLKDFIPKNDVDAAIISEIVCQ